MSELAEILEDAGDTCFTVSFKKKVDKDHVEELLLSTDRAELKDAAFCSKFSKSITEGEECTLVGHLVDAESSLGRSTVIDLLTKSKNKFRQVDHRTINFIIIKNVKYTLRKGAKKGGDEDVDMDAARKKGEPLWDKSKLAVGNTFSGTTYFKAVKIDKDIVDAK